MKLYHLDYVWGWYEDRQERSMGVYSSLEKRLEAKSRYCDSLREMEKDSSIHYGDLLEKNYEHWVEWESELDVSPEL